MIAALLLAAQALPPAEAPPPPQSTCDEPVLMVVRGPTLDRERMMAYAQAIADSKIYEQLGGYYVNVPRAVEVFEGERPANYALLIVRFPCLENARAFWNSRVYQEEIMPLRLDPSAGDYTVEIYPEMPLREDMVGKVGDNSYREVFDAAAVEQAGD